MKSAAFLAVLAIALLSVPSFASDGNGPAQSMTFEQRKTLFLTRIDERITRLQEMRTCVSEAATPEALKACASRQAGEAGRGRQRMGQ
jgi:hypothetical protein